MAGPLASLLMGVGNRAAEHSMRDEQRSYDEASQGRKLANEALMKMLEDPSRTYEEQQSIAGQIETNNKMKAGSLKDAFKFATQLHPHIERAIQQNQQPLPSMPSIPQMGEEAPSASMQYEPAVTIQGGALQGQQAPAMVQPAQTKALPNTQQMPPMPQPPVGMNPQGQSGTQQQAPRSEMERKQQAVAQSVRQHMEDLKSLNLPPEVLQDAIRAGVGIPPSVQAAQVGATSRRDVAKINLLGKQLAGNTGNFVTVQEPGEELPKNVFQITKGPMAGTMLDANTKEPIQLAPGFKKLLEHPDQKQIVTDAEGNVRTVNVTQGKVTAELGKIGAPKTAGNEKLIARKFTDNNGQNMVEYLTPEEAHKIGAFRAPEAAMTQNRKVAAENSIRMSKELFDYIDKPEVKKVMGPMAGRISSWESFIGNPPPEFAELKGMFMSWTELQPALHGMRSAEMAKEIEKQVGPQVSPEALKAFIKGFNRTAQVVATSGTLYPSNEELGGGSSLKKPPPPPKGQPFTAGDGHRYTRTGDDINDPKSYKRAD